MRGIVFVLMLAAGHDLYAHHGGGTFDSSRAVTLAGRLTKIDFINPHSWIYFDVTGADGKVTPYRCETRSAHTLRRSGWTPEMFKIGEAITIEGSPDRKTSRRPSGLPMATRPHSPSQTGRCQR